MPAGDRPGRGTPGVQVAFVWHMHQPDYRDPTGLGDMVLPWVRLHACRAYTDMAWILERHPSVRATVNISPVLADQIEDLTHLRCGDRFLDLSRRSAEDLSHLDRVEILRGFFMIDWEKWVRPVPRYWSLLHKRGRDLKSTDLDRVAERFTEDEMRDLQVLFNLTWMGCAARATEPVVQNLLRKGQKFTEIEKHVLLDTQEKLVSQVLPRWRALAARGQVELSTSPYFHPILPLLVDTDVAREAAPEAALPPRSKRPADARLHVERAIEAHRRHFGPAPAGMWPSEGSVSQEVARLAASCGLRWMASDEEVLRKSTAEGGVHPGVSDHYHPWVAAGAEGEVALFFRDRVLSDLVGFSYSSNPPDEAVLDLMGRLARIGKAWSTGDEIPVVTIVLDGENPWEHYEDSGRPFLEALYEALAEGAHDGVAIGTTTPARWLEDHPPTRRLDHLHAGSWVDACFRVWIGHEETNRAWSLIAEAGRLLDVRGPDLAPENREEALSHLLSAEGSDFTWWYGDDFVTETPEAFDALFRARLAKIYELTGEATPPRLRRAISAAAAGAQSIVPLREPWSLISPVIDGDAAPYVDWQGAGVYRPGQFIGNMYRSTSRIDALHYGCDHSELYVRLDLSDEGRARDDLGVLSVQLFTGDRELEVEMALVRGTTHGRIVSGAPATAPEEIGRVCFGDIVEAALPFGPLEIPRGEVVLLVVRLLAEGVEIERLPRYGHLTVRAPRSNVPISDWQA
jgi:alpha-amylase/alpha-mannosidase (GH57 family)